MMPDLVNCEGSRSFTRSQQPERMVVARAGADREVERRHRLEVVVEHVRPASTTTSSAPSFRRKSGVRISIVAFGVARRTARIVSAKCAAPPSSRSSRSTDVMTT